MSSVMPGAQPKFELEERSAGSCFVLGLFVFTNLHWADLAVKIGWGFSTSPYPYHVTIRSILDSLDSHD